jgi:hypothetical protein
MAQVVFDHTGSEAHIVVGIPPVATIALCGVKAVIFGDHLTPFDRPRWPKQSKPWCKTCIDTFDPQTAADYQSYLATN